MRYLTRFVVGIGEDKKDVLKDGYEKLLEESAWGPWISLRNVVNELDTHVQPGTLHFAIVMFTGPKASINNKLELSGIKLKKS